VILRQQLREFRGSRNRRTLGLYSWDIYLGRHPHVLVWCHTENSINLGENSPPNPVCSADLSAVAGAPVRGSPAPTPLPNAGVLLGSGPSPPLPWRSALATPSPPAA
jgi:hypothetical protein